MLEWVVLNERLSYPDSMRLMSQKVEEVISDRSKAFVMLLEYDDLYTLGSSAKQSDLLNTGNISCYETDRGGQVTYHGPGQRIIYPIIDLSYFQKDIKKYLNFLATALVATFAELGLATFFCPEKIGIWTLRDYGELKIASIGIKVRKWVAYHGIAVNISTDLSKFDGILACGIQGGSLRATSLHALGLPISFAAFDEALARHFFID
jgi:lipoyl(octanoyl) transferase